MAGSVEDNLKQQIDFLQDTIERRALAEKHLISQSSSFRISCLKDYALVGLTVLGVVVTLLIGERTGTKQIIQSEWILLVGSCLVLAATIYSVLARIKFINDLENTSIFLEKRFATQITKIQDLKAAEVKDMPNINASIREIEYWTVPKQHMWVASAHQYSAIVLITGILIIAMSLLFNLSISLVIDPVFIGVVMSILGTGVLFKFGFPQPDFSEEVGIALEDNTPVGNGLTAKEYGEEVAKKKRNYRIVSSVALMMIIGGLILTALKS